MSQEIEKDLDTDIEEEEQESEESTESTEETTDDSNEDSEESKEEVDKIDWEARAKRAEALIEKNKKKAKETKPAKQQTDDALLARLENRGVMESEDQEYVLKFARIEGISPIEALNDPIVVDRLKQAQKARDSREATPTGNNRTAQAGNEVDRWVRKYKRDGSLPDNNPKLTSQILDRLKAGD